MGQKCNPTGLRIGVIKNWDSRWYAKKGEFGDTLVEDYKLRKYLLETLSAQVFLRWRLSVTPSVCASTSTAQSPVW